MPGIATPMPSMATPRIMPPAQPNGKHVGYQQNKRKRGPGDGDEAINTKRFAIQAQRRSLPVAAQEKSIVEKLNRNDTLVIVGETGSGKTTRKHTSTQADRLSKSPSKS